MNDNTNGEDTLEARWVIDSETGVRYLIDVKTNKCIAMKGYEGERDAKEK